MAFYGDRLLFNKKGEDRILLNIGGIANFTYLPANNKKTEIVCTDAGPGNTLMDAFIRQQFPEKHLDNDVVFDLCFALSRYCRLNNSGPVVFG